MEWIRRRAKWPRMLALLLLFGLTLAAPLCWEQVRDTFQPAGALDQEIVPTAESTPVVPEFQVAATTHPVAAPQPEENQLADIVDAGPQLPPVVNVAAEIPVEPVAASGAPLLEDDYALVDEPLPQTAAAAAQTISNAAESMTSMAPLATASPRLPPAPPAETPMPPAAAPRRELDLTKLLAARDALLQLVDDLRSIELPKLPAPQAAPAQDQPVATAPQPTPEPEPERVAEPAPTAQPVQVRVESSHDRLAMLPPKPITGPTPLRLVPPQVTTPTPAVPQVAVVPTPIEPRVAVREKPQPKPEPPLLRLKPAELVRQLQQAAAPPLSAAWAADALTALAPLTTPGAPLDEAAAAVSQLDQLARRGLEASLAVHDPTLQRVGIRAARSISRRIALWQALVDASGPDATAWTTTPTAEFNGEELMPLLNELAAVTAGSDAGDAWRDYLMLDELAALASVGGADEAAQRRTIARQVIARLDSPDLTDAQRDFLATTPAAELAAALRPWASGRIDIAILAALIERYEQKAAQRDADMIAELRARMAFSGEPRQQQLAAELDRYYRNGNMRLAVSGDLLNRLAPQPEPVNTPVRDNVAGADVRGRAQTTTQLEVRLLPDPNVWRFGLEARGTVRSQTYSDTWPAKVRNNAQVDYEARKLILLNRYGLHVWPAEAKTGANKNRLVGVDNSLDVVPLVGPLVEGYAKQQQRERRPRAMAQVRSKVTREARKRLDRETDAKLAVMEQRFTQAVLAPLQQLALAVNPLEMYTTEQRAVMRMRLADEAQLGAHTPRPAAPGDSLASAQLHESALNNAARGLGLDGRKFTSLELYQTLAAQLDRPLTPPEADFPSRATVEFAKTDAVRVRCHDDRVELILSIAELSQGRDRIDDVEVHAFFRPVVEGLSLKLVRDDALQFDGRRLLTGARIVLHSVFGKMLPKDQEIVILAPRVEGDPRFAGLMVTQLVIEDGWLAMALGPQQPQRTAWRSETATTER
ncbi:MAG: hypothetical protein KDA44_00065 [Planctomycetales bacterium]|nr:hypothetical protein [Planctomycetales bacterium]